MSEWKEVKLCEVSNIQTGPFGSQLHKEDYVTNGTPIVTVEHLGNKSFSKQNLPCVKDSDKIRLSKYILKQGDIVFSRVGSVDRCSFVTKETDGWMFSGRCLRVRPYNINSEYLYYFFTLSSTKKTVRNIAVGTTMPSINTTLLSNIVVRFPKSEEEQRSIASILSSLDDKIAVNRRICENLEAQAQALFKHWFIDFAPFKNGKFVESELGMIPEGWRVGTYSDIIQETISGDWGKEKAEGNYTHKVACIRGCDFQDVKMGLRGKTPERFILEKNYQSKHFADKDVLVEISGGTATVSTGRICPVSRLLIDKYEGDIVCTNFCRLVRPIKGYSSYLYYSWKYKYDHKVMFGYENGTSGIKNFSIKDFSSREPLILPEQSALNEFENIIDHIHTQIQNCGSESAKLATLRDTLLPKLMSGQIKV